MGGVTKPILIMKVGIKSFPFRFRKAQEVIDACTTTALTIMILIIDNHRKQRARSTYTAHLTHDRRDVARGNMLKNACRAHQVDGVVRKAGGPRIARRTVIHAHFLKIRSEEHTSEIPSLMSR